MKLWTLLAVLCFVIPASAQSQVGMVTRNFTDEQRQNWEGPRRVR